MSVTKMLALAIMLVFGASQLALLQTNPYAGGGGEGTDSGHPEKAQNNNRGPARIPAAQDRLLAKQPSVAAISNARLQAKGPVAPPNRAFFC